mmetsp:Transcript_23116/g.47060  ORF Transcript_23116/g.47060 Transcript_23116/m.47060 type:complete len:1011 (-) Transcript_23116:47-3079(-)
MEPETDLARTGSKQSSCSSSLPECPRPEPAPASEDMAAEKPLSERVSSLQPEQQLQPPEPPQQPHPPQPFLQQPPPPKQPATSPQQPATPLQKRVAATPELPPMHVPAHAQQLLDAAFGVPISKEAAADLLGTQHELAWLAHCMVKCPKPPGAQPTDDPPLLACFADLVRLMIRWRQSPSEAATVFAALGAGHDAAMAEAARARKQQTDHSGGDPGAAAAFLAKVAQRLQSALPNVVAGGDGAHAGAFAHTVARANDVPVRGPAAVAAAALAAAAAPAPVRQGSREAAREARLPAPPPPSFPEEPRPARRMLPAVPAQAPDATCARQVATISAAPPVSPAPVAARELGAEQTAVGTAAPVLGTPAPVLETPAPVPEPATPAPGGLEEKTPQAVRRVREELGKDVLVCILGGTAFCNADTEVLVQTLAQEFDTCLSARASFITCGLPGVQRTFAEHCGDGSRLCNLLPVGMARRSVIGRDFQAGLDLTQHRQVFEELGDIYITVEGGAEVAQAARKVKVRGAVVIPLIRTGGASCGMFNFPPEALTRPPCATERQWALLGRSDVSIAETVAAVVSIVSGFISLQEELSDSTSEVGEELRAAGREATQAPIQVEETVVPWNLPALDSDSESDVPESACIRFQNAKNALEEAQDGEDDATTEPEPQGEEKVSACDFDTLVKCSSGDSGFGDDLQGPDLASSGWVQEHECLDASVRLFDNRLRAAGADADNRQSLAHRPKPPPPPPPPDAPLRWKPAQGATGYGDAAPAGPADVPAAAETVEVCNEVEAFAVEDFDFRGVRSGPCDRVRAHDVAVEDLDEESLGVGGPRAAALARPPGRGGGGTVMVPRHAGDSRCSPLGGGNAAVMESPLRGGTPLHRGPPLCGGSPAVMESPLRGGAPLQREMPLRRGSPALTAGEARGGRSSWPAAPPSPSASPFATLGLNRDSPPRDDHHASPQRATAPTASPPASPLRSQPNLTSPHFSGTPPPPPLPGCADFTDSVDCPEPFSPMSLG